MIDPGNVPEVTPEEMLARYIFQSSHIRRGNGTVKPDAFIPPANLQCSVTRHLQATEDEIWTVGESLGRQRQQTLHGRADFAAQTCIKQGLAVRKAPLEGNPNHANVTNWPVDKPTQKIIAQELGGVGAKSFLTLV
ncbi:MAG: hypothetical protein ACJ8FY_23650 [Gemmataceae bacterium]